MKKDADNKIDQESIKNLIASQENKQLEPPHDDALESLAPEDRAKAKEKLRADRAQVTGIYKKVNRFLYELKPNDVVIIPSKNSDYVAIGIIASDVFVDADYVSKFEKRLDQPEYDPCPYLKNGSWI